MKRSDRPRAPDRPSPRLRSVRFLRMRGSGEVVLHLNGTGRIRVNRGRDDEFRFEGSGRPRHLSGACILLDRATGRVYLRGVSLEVEFEGGRADVATEGRFTEASGRDAGRSGLRRPTAAPESADDADAA